MSKIPPVKKLGQNLYSSTLKVGNDDGVSILGLLNNGGSLLSFFIADPEFRTSSVLVYETNSQHKINKSNLSHKPYPLVDPSMSHRTLCTYLCHEAGASRFLFKCLYKKLWLQRGWKAGFDLVYTSGRRVPKGCVVGEVQTTGLLLWQ